MFTDAAKQLTIWAERIDIAQKGHYKNSERHKIIQYLISIPLMVLSVTVSSFLFFEDVHNIFLKPYIFGLSILVVILSFLDFFLKPGEKSENHRAHAAKYGGLKRELESFLMKEHTDEELTHFLDKFRYKWDTIADSSPVTSASIRKLYNEKSLK
jgi:hypothetical protein